MSPALAAYAGNFERHAVRFFVFRGRACAIAAEIGEALGYGRDGKNLVDVITKQWADEMIEGQDFAILKGTDLREFKAIVALTEVPSVSANARDLTILYESGIHVVCLKTEKPAGRRLRRFLADKVMPALHRGELALAGGAPEVPALPPARPQLPRGRSEATRRLATIDRVLDYVDQDLAVLIRLKPPPRELERSIDAGLLWTSYALDGTRSALAEPGVRERYMVVRERWSRVSKAYAAISLSGPDAAS